ncbi:hypothetical protein MY3296_008288 [Beauveria thailandica]
MTASIVLTSDFAHRQRGAIRAQRITSDFSPLASQYASYACPPPIAGRYDGENPRRSIGMSLGSERYYDYERPGSALFSLGSAK